MSTFKINGKSFQPKSSMDEIALVLLNEIQEPYSEHLEQNRKFKEKHKLQITLFFVSLVASLMGFVSEEAAPLIIIGVIGAIVTLVSASSVSVSIKNNSFTNPIDSITVNDYKFGLYPFEDGAVLIDETSQSSDKHISFYQINDFKSLDNAQKQYTNTVTNLPLVLSDNEDFSGDSIKQNLKNIKDIYNNASQMSFTLGFIPKTDPLCSYLLNNNFSQKDFNSELRAETESKLNKLSGIIKDTNNGVSEDIDDISLKLVKAVKIDIDKLSTITKESITHFNDDKYTSLNNVKHMRAYNFYCPQCNYEMISDLRDRTYNILENRSHNPLNFNKNTIMKLINWKQGLWECPLCKLKTKHPIPVHKFYDECFLPSYNLLMLENEKDRLKIYTQLRNKIIDSYQNYEKEKNQIIREHKSSISEQKYRLRALKTDVEKKAKVLKSVQGMLEKYEDKFIDELGDVEAKRVQIHSNLIKEANGIEKKLSDETKAILKDVSKGNSEFNKAEKKLESSRDKYLKEIIENDIF